MDTPRIGCLERLKHQAADNHQSLRHSRVLFLPRTAIMCLARHLVQPHSENLHLEHPSMRGDVAFHVVAETVPSFFVPFIGLVFAEARDARMLASKAATPSAPVAPEAEGGVGGDPNTQWPAPAVSGLWVSVSSVDICNPVVERVRINGAALLSFQRNEPITYTKETIPFPMR